VQWWFNSVSFLASLHVKCFPLCSCGTILRCFKSHQRFRLYILLSVHCLDVWEKLEFLVNFRHNWTCLFHPIKKEMPLCPVHFMGKLVCYIVLFCSECGWFPLWEFYSGAVSVFVKLSAVPTLLACEREVLANPFLARVFFGLFASPILSIG
jgi:hypothetical protein